MILLHLVGYVASHPKAMEWTNKFGQEKRSVWFVLSASSKYGNNLFDVYLTTPQARRTAMWIYKGRKIYVISHNGFDLRYNPRIQCWRPTLHGDYIELFIQDRGEEHEPEFEGILKRWEKADKKSESVALDRSPKGMVLDEFKEFLKKET